MWTWRRCVASCEAMATRLLTQAGELPGGLGDATQERGHAYEALLHGE